MSDGLMSERPCSRANAQVMVGENKLPVFFPSVSSVKTPLAPLAYVQALNLLNGGNQFLLSAFDVGRTDESVRDGLLIERKKAAEDGTLVLMDSGNYESYWRAPAVAWSAKEFHGILQLVRPDIAFGFDIQDPCANDEQHLASMLTQLEADRTAAAVVGTLLVPIVHGDHARLDTLCQRLVKDSAAQAVAVPERCLGFGLFERIETVKNIRRALNQTGSYVVLHLLGTGNPLSLALLSEAGADSFDGLEWCQTAVDYSSSLLHHFSHGDLFLSQGRWEDEQLSYPVKVLAHNLDFYTDWMRRVRMAIETNDVRELVRNVFSAHTFDHCVAAGLWH